MNRLYARANRFANRAMHSPAFLRRVLLLSLVAATASNCALTEENRFWDMADKAFADLNSPEMEKAIAEAKLFERPGKKADAR